jgi:predicted nucleic-acid-binding protein
MEFIDANYILRYLLKDNQKQFQLAKDIIENQHVSIPDFILAEVVYVLEKVYAVPKIEIRNTLETLIQYPNITLTDKDICIISLRVYAKHTIDFADALLFALLKSNTGSKLFTFDKKLVKIISKNTPKG